MANDAEDYDLMYGGTCINVACVPTEALVASAAARRPGDDPDTWFASAVERRDGLVGAMRAKNYGMLADLPTVTVHDGHGRFLAPVEDPGDGIGRRHVVTVEAPDGDAIRLTAPVVVVNTGTAPCRPDIPGAHGPYVHDSTTIQHISPRPAELVVIGAGHVGLEFASMFTGFGSHVTVVDRHERILGHDDADVAAVIEADLAASGITFRHDSQVEAIRERDGGALVVLADGTELAADAVLFAVGRTPRSADLGLAEIGLEPDVRGFLPVDEHLRTTVPGVYAVGDINGGPQFTYVSLDDYRILKDQLVGEGRRSTADRVAVPHALFIEPTYTTIGMTEAQAVADHRVLVAAKPVAAIAAMPRPKIEGDPRGLLKILVDAQTDLVLGASLYCLHAEDLVNLVALAMRTGTTAGLLRDAIWTHPSISEGLNEVLEAPIPSTLQPS
ncbi:Pyruvate/2-oxoglutarate dehydrogenase complex, dihydrolipoamide dehydrogenase (E3) component [Raineyella antarctica]|uniref:Pyruvate/2-oxoglutarate dehydrogenase complex, dihydrolipoamide dehydrogenase (E3) component n=1 Tax=Raineyella antarctica TaxID=1577474 RepID=A0A1G6HF44_9ACTN|nr:FAD-dependent oxidoreductase [Raineyella antarctica]SDB92841.1 Pyruvate/2-oxoglutarate dehydrogenase complex, dihydrolipoamide dehydrogenase (E3) component [Raineyella antarctica]